LGIITSLTFRKNTAKKSHYALYCGGADKRRLYEICGIDFLQPRGRGGFSWMRFVEIGEDIFLSYKVKSVSIKNVKDVNVYNFSVKDKQSYIVEQFAVHNCEIPVISTRCCGQLDFLNDDNSYLVDIEGHDIGNQEIRCLSSYYEKAPFAVLGEKTTTQLKETMKYVINNYSEAKMKAGKLRENLVNNFTWEHLVDKVKSRLEKIGRA
jgi:glycosyltransferase involved in cell wall biosynthesis